MIKDIADIILQRIEEASLPWMDKYAGLTRAISTKATPSGKPQTWPIAYDVTDPLECGTDGTPVAALFPDERYRSVLFIECDRFPRRLKTEYGPVYEARFRIVCWLNGKKLKKSDDSRVGIGDVAYMNLVTALDGYTTDVAPYTGIVMGVVGDGPARGREVFGKYTLNEERSQYLHFPFDVLALDLSVQFAAKKGCEEQLIAEDETC